MNVKTIIKSSPEFRKLPYMLLMVNRIRFKQEFIENIEEPLLELFDGIILVGGSRWNQLRFFKHTEGGLINPQWGEIVRIQEDDFLLALNYKTVSNGTAVPIRSRIKLLGKVDIPLQNIIWYLSMTTLLSPEFPYTPPSLYWPLHNVDNIAKNFYRLYREENSLLSLASRSEFLRMI